MNWWLILGIGIVAIAIIWYVQQQNAKAAEQRQADDRRRLPAATNETEQARKSGGLLQEATDIASGRSYQQAAGQIGEMSADLAQARRDAELAAERLAGRAGEALAAVQAAAATHGGAVPGDGTHDCPPGYPIKGNMPTMRYHLPEQPSYTRTIPEVCFQSVAAAEAAGFAESGDETGMRGGAVAAAAVAAEDVVDDPAGDGLEAVAAEAIDIRDRENGERSGIVAEALEAADAGSVPPGAVRGDGSRDCPPTYPIKANQSTRLFLDPSSSAYAATIPELCFSSIESARTAGMSPAPN